MSVSLLPSFSFFLCVCEILEMRISVGVESSCDMVVQSQARPNIMTNLSNKAKYYDEPF